MAFIILRLIPFNTAGHLVYFETQNLQNFPRIIKTYRREYLIGLNL